ncbi:hypothetical protein EDD21DRAFT_95004 [Dissophora ornata]|nr:hypothetical protein EDD21DRAFT_95004 [Dissophora ornata]
MGRSDRRCHGSDHSRVQNVDLAFTDVFLLRPTFVEPPPPPPQSLISSSLEIAQDSLSALLSSTSSSLSSPSSEYSRSFNSSDSYAPHNPNEVGLISDILRRYMDSAEQVLYLSHTFSVMWSGSIDTREDIGQHIHFTEAINDLVAKVVRATLWGQGGDDSSPIQGDDEKTTEEKTPHIAVHLRRGDIGTKCKNRTYHVPEDCAVHLWRYAAAVEPAKEDLQRISEGKGDDAGPAVIVTTDTASEQDLEGVRALGWHLIDHVKFRTNEVLGMFGEVMVDSAEVFVGTRGLPRQRSWHGHMLERK